MLLVPESNMKLRALLRVLVVLPFTEIPVESSDHVSPVPAGNDAKTRSPERI